MSAGLPIVATDVGGTNEAIKDGDSGLLVPPHQAQALADAMTRLVNERELSARLGRRAREQFEKNFTLKKMIDGTLRVYSELL
jgi:glycosyltransferase involved in cell wall biosynthesis